MMRHSWTETWAPSDTVHVSDSEGDTIAVGGPDGFGYLLTSRAADANELVSIIPGAGSDGGARQFVVWAGLGANTDRPLE